ncbi:MAG: ribosome maturation factor RimM [Oscillospiraceae bacterium]|nr:ribosome maturation factor RimM [Oscillospiraceae bacterium]
MLELERILEVNMKEYLEIGEIVGTHGIKGEVRVYPWADSGEFLLQFDTLYFDEQGKAPIKIIKSYVHKNVVVMKLEGVEGVEKASALRSKVLWMRREDAELEEGAYFIQDLIGLNVLDKDTGKLYGQISDVSATGANDVYHIKGEDGREVLIAAVPSVVIDIEPEQGLIRIRPLKGSFEDEN